MARQLRHAIGDQPVIIFNARFDTRILKQTAAAHSDPADWLEEMTVYCAMELAAGYYGATNRYGTISLASAASQAGLTWEGLAHSAIADTRMTSGVVNAITAYHQELLQLMYCDNPELNYANLKSLQKQLDEMYTCIRNNHMMLPNYGKMRRYGEPVSTAFVESTINEVIARQ